MIMITSVDLNKVHEQVRKMAHKVNSFLIRSFNGEITHEDHNKVNLPFYVTKIDDQTEKVIRDYLSKEFPDFGFILEEDSRDRQKSGKYIKELNWVIDSIDGTLNFNNKIPIFGFSIALWNKKEPLYSLISLPMQGDIIHAVKGKGTFMNEKSFWITDSHHLATPYVLYSHFGPEKDKVKLHRFLLKYDPYPRFLGSSVYHIGMLTLRRAEFGVFINNALWDIAAGMLIAKECGLHVEFISKYPEIIPENFEVLKSNCHCIVIGEKETAIKVAHDIKKLLKI